MIRVLVLGLVLAAAKKEDPATIEAKVTYKRGEVAFKLGRFDEALKDFSKAYEVKPIAAFLFNIAQCHFNLKNYERAVFFFEGYLRDAQNAAQAKTAAERLKEAKAALAEQKAEAERKEAERERVERERAAAAPRQIASAPVVAPSAPLTLESGPPRAPVYKKWWFWTILSGIAVAGAVAGVMTWWALQPAPRVLPTGSDGTTVVW